MKEKVKRWGGWILSIVVILIGCKSSETAERTIGGAALEAVGSAVIGGKAGVVISKNIAGQKAELDVVLPQKRAIETVRKGEALKVTFDAGLLFVKNASTLSDTAKYILRQLATSLNRHTDTDLAVMCYTDNTGQPELNRMLSERRAKGICDYLATQGVDSRRMTFRGMGALYPAADNRTPTGRTQNRRTELWFLAGEQMIREAQSAPH